MTSLFPLLYGNCFCPKEAKSSNSKPRPGCAGPWENPDPESVQGWDEGKKQDAESEFFNHFSRDGRRDGCTTSFVRKAGGDPAIIQRKSENRVDIQIIGGCSQLIHHLLVRAIQHKRHQQAHITSHHPHQHFITSNQHA